MKIKKNSARAIARKVSSIRGFFKYLTLNLKILNENPVKNLELPSFKKTLPKYLSVNESKQLLEKKSKSNYSTKFNEACVIAIKDYLTKERAKLKKIVDEKALFLASRTGKRLGAL